MSKKKGDKIRKLRKAHIWPTVVFTLFSLILAAVAVVLFVALMMTYLIQDRMTVAFSNVVTISDSIHIDAENADAILADIPTGASYTDTVVLVDKNLEVIAGNGEATFNKDGCIDGELAVDVIGVTFSDTITEAGLKLRTDLAFRDNLVTAQGDFNFLNVFTEENFPKFFYTDNNLDTTLFNAVFWAERELSDDRLVMVRCSLPFYFKDFVEALSMGCIAFVMMLIPIIFLFVNVIFNVHTQKRMTKLLYTDAITEGGSMTYFEHSANKEMTARAGRTYAIADITVMKFRSFCNYHGAKAGDELLAAVDKQLKTYLRKHEYCAHSGKSSFAVLLECPDREKCVNRVTSITELLTENFRHGGLVFHSGVYFAEPSRLRDAADGFNRAGAARATITDENSPLVAVYDDKLLEEQIWEHKVEEKMQTALEKEEFKVFVQPKYDPVTEKLAGAEALVRWINEEDGFIGPGRFIPIFEKNGFITKIDDYMLSHVAQLQAQWLRQGKDVVPVSVNISRAHFADPDLAQHISRIVDAYNVPHNLIEIELTESAFFDDKAALLRTVHSLSECGFEISMDDFGAGYSSLNSLKDLPLDVLKLDAEFFRGEAADEDRGEIVVSEAINLAKKLNMRIVAEGVEKKEQVDFLAKQGCDMIQGFYFAKPMPADEYAQRLDGGINAAPQADSPAQTQGAPTEAPAQAAAVPVPVNDPPQETQAADAQSIDAQPVDLAKKPEENE